MASFVMLWKYSKWLFRAFFTSIIYYLIDYLISIEFPLYYKKIRECCLALLDTAETWFFSPIPCYYIVILYFAIAALLLLIYKLRSKIFHLQRSLGIIPESSYVSLSDCVAAIKHKIPMLALYKYYNLCDCPMLQHIKNNIKLQREYAIIFTLIIKKHLLLYGYENIVSARHVINASHLSQIPNDTFKPNNLYCIDNWSQDFKTLYDRDNGYEYTNVSMKREELDEFIKKHS